MSKYICIHGHFYQPPRENPWLEAIELQDSAWPYHDWNERITAECYGPNSAARLLEPGGSIIGITNNFSRISFNMGPTLLAWMEFARPDIYEAIIEADRQSLQYYSGHGTAIAQAFNHMIMPLANSRDKRTQIEWGVRDFEKRFGRKPEGMWVAETAIDLETLDIMVEYGIKYTILAPRQAHRSRKIDNGEWEDVSGSRINPRRSYYCALPSGKEIALFFYDGPISQDIAFGGLLDNGEYFSNRLLSAMVEDDEEPQIVHIATDGESYGHHHHHGEMALSYCNYFLEQNDLAKITNYGEFLENHPPEYEVEIYENSSWSCVHGIERWRSDCGCNSGGRPGWNQSWRKPLREALDWLRDTVSPYFEREASKLIKDPWAARNDYIDVLHDRRDGNVLCWIRKHQIKELEQEDHVRLLHLMELQRQAMLMYTSCGWFFDELSGIETTQVIQYAGRLIQLLNELKGPDLEDSFLEKLAAAPSNLPEHGNGANIYKKFVRPAAIDLQRVGVHYAITSLFQEFQDEDKISCYQVRKLSLEKHQAGKFRIAMGRIQVRSEVTWDSNVITFTVLHLGDQNVTAGVRDYIDEEMYDTLKEEMRESFFKSDIPQIIRLIDRHFEDKQYSLMHLFHDQQRQIMETIFDDTEQSIENFYRDVFHDHYHLLNAMTRTGHPLPRILRTTAEFLLNLDLRRVLEAEPLDEAQYRSIVDNIQRWSIPLDKEMLAFSARGRIGDLVHRLAETPLEDQLLYELEGLLQKYVELNITLNLWESQNTIYQIGVEQFYVRNNLAREGEESAARWVERFRAVAELLGVKFQ